ncbi:hypothetical protein [Streptomyces sp. Inha503]|uniref:hypothetical protein n=1 Tax=Streptomyces sp. Inha503 TaxID=3383314 RepID=UPI00399FEB05
MRLGGPGGGTRYPLELAAALLATLPVAALFETALDRTARTHGQRVRNFSDEQKSASFAAAALVIEDLSPSLAHRLLGPLRLALGDTYPVPAWADNP